MFTHLYFTAISFLLAFPCYNQETGSDIEKITETVIHTICVTSTTYEQVMYSDYMTELSTSLTTFVSMHTLSTCDTQTETKRTTKYYTTSCSYLTCKKETVCEFVSQTSVFTLTDNNTVCFTITSTPMDTVYQNSTITNSAESCVTEVITEEEIESVTLVYCGYIVSSCNTSTTCIISTEIITNSETRTETITLTSSQNQTISKTLTSTNYIPLTTTVSVFSVQTNTFTSTYVTCIISTTNDMPCDTITSTVTSSWVVLTSTLCFESSVIYTTPVTTLSELYISTIYSTVDFTEYETVTNSFTVPCMFCLPNPVTEYRQCTISTVLESVIVYSTVTFNDSAISSNWVTLTEQETITEENTSTDIQTLTTTSLLIETLVSTCLLTQTICDQHQISEYLSCTISTNTLKLLRSNQVNKLAVNSLDIVDSNINIADPVLAKDLKIKVNNKELPAMKVLKQHQASEKTLLTAFLNKQNVITPISAFNFNILLQVNQEITNETITGFKEECLNALLEYQEEVRQTFIQQSGEILSCYLKYRQNRLVKWYNFIYQKKPVNENEKELLGLVFKDYLAFNDLSTFLMNGLIAVIEID